MNAIGRVLGLSLAAVVAVLVANCGGKTTGDTPGDTTLPPRTPSKHRPSGSSCVGVHSPPEPSGTIAVESTCTSHADCTSGTNGKCVHGFGMAWSRYWCTYDQCATDADCDAGKVCHCSTSTAAQCLSVGNCQTDADCGGGSYGFCSPSMGSGCGRSTSITGYYCHSPKDGCIDDSDCTEGNYCSFDVYDGRWKCTAFDNGCVIG